MSQVNFATKRHELNVSTYQMCVLLLFNEAERLSYGEILEATQIAAAELKRNLQSLACVKVRPRPKALNPEALQRNQHPPSEAAPAGPARSRHCAAPSVGFSHEP